jgi:small subunit ribosomal protein S20
LHNRAYRGQARTAVKKARQLMAQGNFEEARTAVQAAVRALDKAAAKGIIHKNNAARRKSRLMQQLNQADFGETSASLVEPLSRAEKTI